MREKIRQKNVPRRKIVEIIEWKDIVGYHIKSVTKILYGKNRFKIL